MIDLPKVSSKQFGSFITDRVIDIIYQLLFFISENFSSSNCFDNEVESQDIKNSLCISFLDFKLFLM